MYSNHQISEALAKLDPVRKNYYVEMINLLTRRKRAYRESLYENPEHEELHETIMQVLCNTLSPEDVDAMLLNLAAEMSAIMNAPRHVTARCSMEEYVELRSGQLAERITTAYLECCAQLGVDQ